MITGDKEYIKQQTSNPILIEKIDKIKAKYLVLDVFSQKIYKSRKQNNLFHGLITCFWSSGCSSFQNWDDLRNHYKKIAGLIKTNRVRVEGFEIIKETHKSWGDVRKENATIVINQLMFDMDEANVLGSSQGKKYQEILKGLGEWFEGLK